MSLIKKVKSNAVLMPILSFGKRHVYNVYHGAKLKVSEFPPEVWIENTNCCNARCVMCPRGSHTRPLGFMDFFLFEKLIREISIHKNTVKRVNLHNYGEPLLDKELPRRINLAKDYGIGEVYFVTNASLLTSEISKDIIEAGLDEFKISFYGTDRETYNATMKELDFDKSIKNIIDFFKTREALKSKTPKVVIQYLPLSTNKSRTDDFENIFGALIDKDRGDCLNIWHLHNFGGGKAYHKIGRITGICNYPWRTMVILHDGRVVICCLDYNGIQVVGDVNKNTIQEIWNSDKYRQSRSDFKKLKYEKYPICMKCSAIR